MTTRPYARARRISQIDTAPPMDGLVVTPETGIRHRVRRFVEVGGRKNTKRFARIESGVARAGAFRVRPSLAPGSSIGRERAFAEGKAMSCGIVS